MFKKLLLSSFILFCFSVNIVSDEVTMESDGTIHEFNYFTVTDPQNFMMALDKFDNLSVQKNGEMNQELV